MPPEVRHRLFTRHAVSTKATGTGLGTKIVKDVVDAHRGQITVASAPSFASAFRLTLPGLQRKPKALMGRKGDALADVILK